MLNDFWKQFKSGTDIRGVAVDGAGYEVNLTDETITAMVNGFILWLSKKTEKNTDELIISIGRDSRISGSHIAKISMEAMKKAGVTVYNCDLASTPSMFMTTVDLDCDGALQITASHHPYYRNGLKFFTRDGGLEGWDIVAVLEHAQNNDKPNGKEDGEIIEVDYMNQYAASLREMIKESINDKYDYDHPLKGFKIVVDAGNGAGGFYATDVLEALGADIRGSQFLEPDGMFPNHIPNPEDTTAMKFISDAVKKVNADLGVIFDTDVDRGGAVDHNGKEINRNRLVAIAAAIALENNKGGLIVTDSITSSGLKDFIEKELGGKHLRFKRGYKNVIDEALKQNANGVNCPLAIETSGHAAIRENYFLDDGAYLVTKIIIKLAQLKKEGKTLESLIEKLDEPVESKEIRIAITEKDFTAYGEKVIENMFKFAKEHKEFKIADDNHEGIRVSFDKKNGDGWFLLRLSVHDPIMPLNIESNSVGGVDKIYNKIKPFLEDCVGLDTYVKKATAVKKTSVKKATAKVEPKTEIKTETKTADKTEPKKEVKAETKTTAKTEPKKEVKAETKTADKTEPKKEVKAETKTTAKTEPKKEVKTETKTADKTEPKKEVKAETKTTAKTEPKKEVKSETKTSAKTELKKEVKTETNKPSKK